MKIVAAAFLGALAIPATAFAAQAATAGHVIDATTQLPDTTYRVVVDRVSDPTHMDVTFQSGRVDLVGAQGVLTAGRSNMSFANVHPGDTLMLSTSRGTVLVFKDYGVVAAPTSTP